MTTLSREDEYTIEEKPGHGDVATLSRKDLISFLDWAGENGMIKLTTVRSLRSACTTVLSVLDDEEAGDITSVNLDSVFDRYKRQRRPEMSPATMQAYRRRIGYAIEECLRYEDERNSWLVSGGHMTGGAGRLSVREENSRPSGGQSPAGMEWGGNVVVDAADIVHHFPLRRDVVVTVTGIPFDVKKSEMSRLTAFLSKLVVCEGDEVASGP